MTQHPALTLVMPVYNEEAAVAGVVRAWAAELDRLGIDYELRVYDDGSRDRSAEVLEALSSEIPRLLVTRHANRGHGPTILRGYREARGEWVFQTDSDGEMEPDSFGKLWERRHQHDFLFGVRAGREWTAPRWVMTRASRLAVRALFGRGVEDVNTPYRLMRRQPLARLLAGLPDDLFAPNVILSGLAVRAGLRIWQTPVPHQGRRHGGGSLGSLRKLWKPASRSLRQTIAIARAGAGDPDPRRGSRGDGGTSA
ncbi:MAG TPA: glycosyltransferase family 2 protein [Thermoanaerobaculia bacterium]|nr:glycosyltransferase family 2 protein [Thermoanaerobaculia bacterium]